MLFAVHIRLINSENAIKIVLIKYIYSILVIIRQTSIWVLNIGFFCTAELLDNIWALNQPVSITVAVKVSTNKTFSSHFDNLLIFVSAAPNRRCVMFRSGLWVLSVLLTDICYAFDHYPCKKCTSVTWLISSIFNDAVDLTSAWNRKLVEDLGEAGGKKLKVFY